VAEKAPILKMYWCSDCLNLSRDLGSFDKSISLAFQKDAWAFFLVEVPQVWCSIENMTEGPDFPAGFGLVHCILAQVTCTDCTEHVSWGWYNSTLVNQRRLGAMQILMVGIAGEAGVGRLGCFQCLGCWGLGAIYT
jgi:hypothetical protein